MGLFRNNKILQFGAGGLIANHKEVQRTKERNGLLRKNGGMRGSAVNKESIGGNMEFKA